MPIRVPLRLPVQSRPQPVPQTTVDSSRVIRGSTTVPPGERPRYACDVVIPYYRGLKWLPQTIEAVLTQNSVDCHVHLINDQSPEDDTEIRKSFKNFSNLFWYRNKDNIGPYRSYHQVWTRLKTDFFAVQDADDVPLPNRLWRALDALHSSGADIYGAAMEQMLSPDVPVDDEWNRRYVEQVPIHSSGYVSQYSPKGNVINGTMVCHRRSFERLNGFAGRFTCSCDIEFVTRAHHAGCRFFLDDSIVAIRRVHQTSLSRGGKFRLGTRAREQSFAEWQRRYAIYEEAEPDFDFAAYGALHEADPALTVEVAND